MSENALLEPRSLRPVDPGLRLDTFRSHRPGCSRAMGVSPAPALSSPDRLELPRLQGVGIGEVSENLVFRLDLDRVGASGQRMEDVEQPLRHRLARTRRSTP